MTRTRRSWTLDEKRRIATDVRRRLAAGERWASIGRDLRIHDSTLRAWLRLEPQALFEPVTVSDEGTGGDGVELSLTTPDGFVFGPLDLDAAVRLWERLR